MEVSQTWGAGVSRGDPRPTQPGGKKEPFLWGEMTDASLSPACDVRAKAHHVQRLARWLSGKEFTCQCRKWGFDPWVGKTPLWRRKWQPTPVFVPGESQGLGSLVGCRLWGRTGLDTTEAT